MTQAYVARRDVLAWVGAVAAVACGGSPSPVARQPAREEADRFKLDPIIDLIPAAGLVWLVAARPREILASSALGRPTTTIISTARFEGFARHHGGVDIRFADEIAIASFPSSTLTAAHVRFDADRVEKAFAARVASVEGRSAERGLTRAWGRGPGGREQIALLAGEGLIFERGQMGPLQAAVYFSQGRLRRALPALLAAPLASVVPLLGDAPLRMFAPGPFEGEWARGIAGLLRASTAVGAAVRPVSNTPDAAIGLRLLLTGGWGQDAPAAALRLRSAFGVLAEDPFGRLTGMNRPLDGPVVSTDPGALRLDVILDAVALSRGLHAATDASLDEIMNY